MPNFEKPPRQEQHPEPTQGPEHGLAHAEEGPEAIQKKLEGLLKQKESEENAFLNKESGFFAIAPEKRLEHSKEIDRLSRELAQQVPAFKDALILALTETLDDMELGEKSWTEEMIARAFRAYTGHTESLF